MVLPKEWDKKRELTWTITVNGKTQKAFAWLQPEWEIDPAGGAATGGRTDKEFISNKAPAITIAPVASAMVKDAVTLNAKVTDDGIPKPAPPRKPAIGQETPPALQGDADAPVNVPSVAGAGRQAGGGGRGGPQGPTVTWTVWRGPANADVRTASLAGQRDRRADSCGVHRTRRVHHSRTRERPVADDRRGDQSHREITVRIVDAADRSIVE